MHKKRLQLRSPCRSWGRFSRFPSWKRKVWLVKSWRYDSTEEKTRGAHFTVSRLPGHKGPDVTGIYLASAAHGFRRLTNKAKTASRKRKNLEALRLQGFSCCDFPQVLLSVNQRLLGVSHIGKTLFAIRSSHFQLYDLFVPRSTDTLVLE